MREEVLKEVLKLLPLGIISSIPDSKWMLERLAGKQYFCFLDGYSGYFQIYVDPEDQEKTTFTCLFGTYAYRRMSFGLCNAPGTFKGEDKEDAPDAFPEEHLYNAKGSTVLISLKEVLDSIDPEAVLNEVSKRQAEPWFADLAHYLVTGELPSTPEVTRAQRLKIKSEAKYYFWDDPYLWEMGVDQVIRKCISEWDQEDILVHCHSLAYGGHFGPKKTVRKVLDNDFY
ncbi:uncharacterized protein LOC121804088 [Salvia splendens]|uniref:uncharacterized protein LOC121804088 n=1 Tax=Salvia splendens TaxID=180675 RepID=UPI001C26A953|nr:uncharacterized protein LOC121804088 [Salvia splendens]